MGPPFSSLRNNRLDKIVHMFLSDSKKNHQDLKPGKRMCLPSTLGHSNEKENIKKQLVRCFNASLVMSSVFHHAHRVA